MACSSTSPDTSTASTTTTAAPSASASTPGIGQLDEDCREATRQLASLPPFTDFQSLIRLVGTIANDALILSAAAANVAPDSPVGPALEQLGQAATDFVTHASPDDFDAELDAISRAYDELDRSATAGGLPTCDADAWGRQLLPGR